jgi:DNA phosphorothioation-dependent restriction protein DptG
MACRPELEGKYEVRKLDASILVEFERERSSELRKDEYKAVRALFPHEVLSLARKGVNARMEVLTQTNVTKELVNSFIQKRTKEFIVISFGSAASLSVCKVSVENAGLHIIW